MTKKSKIKFYPSALTVSGSVPGGGAGVAADLRTFNAFGVYGCCAVTAVSADPAGSCNAETVSAANVTAQIDSVLKRIPVKFCKSGMLYSPEIINAVFDSVEKHQLKLVCDPVIFSGNKKVSDGTALQTLAGRLQGHAAWITPGIREAEILADRRISSVRDMLDAAAVLAEKFDVQVFLRGDSLKADAATDVIARDGRLYTLTSPLPEVTPAVYHGAGCALSAALTAMLALDLPWKQAVCESKAFVYGSLSQCVEIGPGVKVMYPPSEDTIQLIKLDETER